MKNFRTIILLSLASLSLFNSCEKSDKLDSKSVFVDSDKPKNALDNYIYENITKPYNIQILYKYVDRESDVNYHLVPATYDGSVRLTKLLIYLGTGPYDQVTGSKQFVRDNFARLFNYIGNVAVQNNGSVILGTAENGAKISLYNVINLNATSGLNQAFLNQYYFKTVHHETQHIFNQRKPFPTGFNEITGTAYVDDAWNQVWASSGAAIAAGFISTYASKAPTEDFAELYSFYITRSQAEFDAMLNVTGSTAAGRALIASKLTIVKNYMNSEWGINMDQLRQVILDRYANLNSFDQTTLN
ncbi:MULTISPECIES: putative zinc-binding metallopeptidase [Sphingobacterium]|uniref:zinc-binding metallopeptidase n=1 Tax=Sphingobacterium TaxID=28453 RepID=UPI00191AA903|nr:MULTISPECIES: putative zinc-binding metallopeptidase [Sphingobacterium]QQT27125.1 putative zinc-binding metallopeptidase [Sphingobacterium spiritivorum]